MTLEFLFWCLLAATLIGFWWQSDRVKQHAMNKVMQACRQQELQFLDQTMVLQGLRPQRTKDGRWKWRRRYQFEFTTTGQARYRGQVTLTGRDISRLEMEPHIIPDTHQRLH